MNSMEDSRSTKIDQMMTIGWPLTFLLQDQICVPICVIYGENVEKSFSQNVFFYRLTAETYNV